MKIRTSGAPRRFELLSRFLSPRRTVATKPISDEGLTTPPPSLNLNNIPYRFIDPIPCDTSAYSLSSFEMHPDSKRAFEELKIAALFPIQGAVWSEILKGKDVIARARTGTGKTLAFALPIITKLTSSSYSPSNSLPSKHRGDGRPPRALVIAPTRELATQIASSFQKFAPRTLSCCVLYGGVSIGPQLSHLQTGTDVVIGTPGRLLDLVNRGALDLKSVEMIVLDEADFMLDLGFKADLEAILSNTVLSPNAPPGSYSPQMMLFSATVPEWVLSISKSYFKRPEKVFVDAVGETKIRTSEKVRQVALAFRGTDLPEFVSEILETFCPASLSPMKAIVFCETKIQASILKDGLFLTRRQQNPQQGQDGLSSDAVPTPAVEALHGGLTQLQRDNCLNAFKNGRVNVLVATDVASRGLDIADVDCVVQLQLPSSVETFIHRSGRTARAGKGGVNVLIYDPATHSKDIETVENTAGFKFSRQALQVGRALTIKDPLTFCQILRGISPAEKEAVSGVVTSLLSAQDNGSPKDIITSLVAILHRSFPISVKVNRSALTGEKGSMTMMFTPAKSPMSFNPEAYVQCLTNAVSIIKPSSITHCYITMDKKSLIFDVPVDIGDALVLQDEVDEVSEHGSLCRVLEVPPYFSTFRNNVRGGPFSSNISYGMQGQQGQRVSSMFARFRGGRGGLDNSQSAGGLYRNNNNNNNGYSNNSYNNRGNDRGNNFSNSFSNRFGGGSSAGGPPFAPRSFGKGQSRDFDDY